MTLNEVKTELRATRAAIASLRAEIASGDNADTHLLELDLNAALEDLDALEARCEALTPPPVPVVKVLCLGEPPADVTRACELLEAMAAKGAL